MTVCAVLSSRTEVQKVCLNQHQHKRIRNGLHCETMGVTPLGDRIFSAVIVIWGLLSHVLLNVQNIITQCANSFLGNFTMPILMDTLVEIYM